MKTLPVIVLTCMAFAGAAFQAPPRRVALTSTVLHPNRAQRDGHLNSGMEQGAGETYDRLADFIATNLALA